MTIGLVFWILMLLWLVLGAFWNWPQPGVAPNYGALGGSLLIFVLFLLLGWHAFGPPIHG